MAQTDNSWIVQLATTSPIIQVGIAIGSGIALVYVVKSGYEKLVGKSNDEDKNANEKTRIALDALAKVADAQARLIELQQSALDGHLDKTDVSKLNKEG